ncbi:hypothetical protein RUND412_000735 [Rhizina undulata]
MGQGSSTDTGSSSGGGQGTMKACYYELLSVQRDATQDEIKKAYRKKALELHPDRNYDDVERTTKLFAEVQAAYEVLSDPQERAWYDSHREAILRDDGDVNQSDNASRAHNVNVTTSEDILQWFSVFSAKIPHDDSPKSFYKVIGAAFSKLAAEEITACKWDNLDPIYYPDFGSSKSNYEDFIKPFYAAWANFRTQKSFSWCDAYRYSDAPDRRVKRLMEKENKKLRDAAIKEFNETVRSFVLFVRKRDPRYLPNTQSESQRQATLLAASKEQAARHRAENAAKMQQYEAPTWTKVDADAENEYLDSELDSEDEEEVEREIYECIVCKKTFRSEAQYAVHEQNKKHKKAVEALKRQMRKDNKDFDLDRDVRGLEKTEFTPMDDEDDQGEDLNGDVDKIVVPDDNESTQHKKSETDDEELGLTEDEGDVEPEEEPITTKNKFQTKDPSLPPQMDDEEEDEDDEYVSREKFEARVFGKETFSTAAVKNLAEDLEKAKLGDTTPAQRKIGKAKAKRARQAAELGAAAQVGGETKCAACQEPFTSKTKLFNHLKENPTHAKPVPSTGGKGGKKKGKGKS